MRKTTHVAIALALGFEAYRIGTAAAPHLRHLGDAPCVQQVFFDRTPPTCDDLTGRDGVPLTQVEPRTLDPLAPV